MNLDIIKSLYNIAIRPVFSFVSFDESTCLVQNPINTENSPLFSAQDDIGHNINPKIEQTVRTKAWGLDRKINSLSVEFFETASLKWYSSE